MPPSPPPALPLPQQPSSTITDLSSLPQTIILSDNVFGETRMPLRAAVINGTATNPDLSKSTRGQLNDWYPIVSFHFEDPGSRGLVNIKHLLTGPIKSYQTPADILQGANYFENIPLNEQASLEMNQPGLNYLVLAVQFADGTSGVYSGVMDVDAIGSKSQGEDYLDFQLDEGATFRVMDTSSVGNIQSDTPFLSIKRIQNTRRY